MLVQELFLHEGVYGLLCQHVSLDACAFRRMLDGKELQVVRPKHEHQLLLVDVLIHTESLDCGRKVLEVVPFDVPLIEYGELPEESLLGSLSNCHQIKDMNKEEFLLEMQRLAFEVEKVIESYGNREEVLSLMVTGLLEEDEEGEQRIKAIYSYNMDSEDEMLSVLNFVEQTFTPAGHNQDDLDDLLDGLGISLN